MGIQNVIGKILVSTLVITSIMGGNITSASEKSVEVNSPSKVVYFNEKDEDQRVQEEIIRQSQKTRADGDVWTLQTTETLKSNVLLTAKVGDMVPKDTSKKSSLGLSLSGGRTLYGFNVNVGFTYSQDYTVNGPNANTALAKNTANGYLTHNVAVGYTKGNIVRYTYKVTNKYSGQYLRTETVVSALRTEASYYTIGVQSGSYFKAENSAGNKYKTFTSYSDYANKIANIDSTLIWW